MKIKMLVGLAGNEYALSPGDEREFPDNEAIRLVGAGFAIPVAEIKIERAVVVPPQERRATKARGGKRGKHVVSIDSNDSAD